jgi:5-methylcytosine-specific restriction endonuclease McrA
VKPTSRKRKVSAVKAEATRLHSQIVRATKGPYCQNGCGRLATDCAHIIGRTYAHTRTDEANSFALCAQCHRLFTNWVDDWMAFVDRAIGRAEYERLKAKAQAGVNVKFDWYAELDRLREVAQRMGVAA